MSVCGRDKRTDVPFTEHVLSSRHHGGTSWPILFHAPSGCESHAGAALTTRHRPRPGNHPTLAREPVLRRWNEDKIEQINKQISGHGFRAPGCREFKDKATLPRRPAGQLGRRWARGLGLSDGECLLLRHPAIPARGL